MGIALALFLAINSFADYTRPYVKRSGKVVEGYYHKHRVKKKWSLEEKAYERRSKKYQD